MPRGWVAPSSPPRRRRKPVRLSPDAADLNQQARQRNIRRGASPHGGPGAADVRSTQKLASRVHAGSASTVDVQRHLRQAGFNVVVDGRWGPETARAWGQFTGTLAHGMVANERARYQYLSHALARSAPNPAEEMATLGPEGVQELRAARQRLREHVMQMKKPVRSEISAGVVPTDPKTADYFMSALTRTIPNHQEERKLLGDHGFATLQAERARRYKRAQEVSAAQPGSPATAATNVLIKGSLGALDYGGLGVLGDVVEHPTNPYDIALAASMILPPVRAARGAVAGVEALRAGAGVRASVAAAKAVYHHPGVISRVLIPRIMRAGNLVVRIPAARSRTGRVVEHIADQLRNPTSRIARGMVKSTSERAYEEMGRGAKRYQSRIDETHARALEKVGKKLNDPQEYALRIVAEGTTPEERFAHHLALAQESKSLANHALANELDDTLYNQQALYHHLHAGMIQKAAKYVVVKDGVPELAPDAPKHLHEALRLLLKVTQTREGLYQMMGLLTDEQIANRISAPKRYFLGARYKEAEVQLQDAMEQSPVREQAFQAIDHLASDQTERNALKRIWDANVRSAALTVHEDQRAFGEILDKLRGIQGGLTNENLPPDMLAQASWSGGESPPPGHVPGLSGPRTNEDLQRIAGDPQLLDAAVVELRFRADKGEDIASIVNEVASKYGVPKAALAQHLSTHGDALAERILSNREVWSEGDPAYDVARGVEDTLNGSGGHTWLPNLTTDTGTDGYLASIKGSERIVPVDAFDANAVQQYRQDMDHLLQDERARLGSWKQNDRVYLDSSLVFDNADDALKMARKNGDLAIFDRANMDTIATGVSKQEHDAAMGVGEQTLAQGELFPEEERAAWEAFARDIKANLPEHEWPQWVRNIDKPVPKPVEWPETPPAEGTVDWTPSDSNEADFAFRLQGKLREARDQLVAQRPDDANAIYHSMLNYVEDAFKKSKFFQGHEYEAARDVVAPLMKELHSGDTFPEDWLAQRQPQSISYYKNLVRHDPEIQNAIGENPGGPEIIQGLHRAFNVAMKKRDVRAAGILGEEASRLYQRGGTGFGSNRVGPYGIKAAITFEGPQHAIEATIRFSEHADITSWIHETAGHFFPQFLSESDYRSLAKWAGGNFDPGRGAIDEAAAEKVARGMEQYLRRGVGPPGLKQAFRSVAPKFQELYDGVDLPDYTAQIAGVFERMFTAPRLRGGSLVGAEDIGPVGLARVPTIRGRPLPRGITSTHRRLASYTRYILGGGRMIGKGADDKALRRAYTAAAYESGYFTFAVVKPATQDLILASRLAAVHRVREQMLESARDLPTDISDIAIKVNPDKATPESVALTLERMREIDSEGGKITDKMLGKIDPNLFETAARDLFPNELDGTDIRTLAQELLNEQQPIDNVKWIPREWLDASGLMPKVSHLAGQSKKVKAAAQAGLITIDAINDMQKMFVLYLNPAYVPVNLVGNLVMNFMQQGAFTGVNLWRSALAHQFLDVEHRVLMDSIMGNGLTASLGLRTGPGQIVHATLGHWINQGVDLIPRRAAFMHEARREGFKTKEQMRGLLDRALNNDQEARQLIEDIGRRANDAIVDYERMSPLEREITSRLIFFYPWLKGATRYTMRFGLEHPMQAAGLIALGEHAYRVQQQQLGATPYYEQTDVPVSTESIGVGPYSLSNVIGKHQWNVDMNGESMPMVVDARQALTMATPVELVQAATAFVTGDKNAQGLVESLTPALYSAGVALYGYDPFRHKEVPHTLASFVKQLQDVPQVQRFQALTIPKQKSRERQANAINPRTREMEWWRTFGSGLAPAPYSRSVAAERLLSDLPTKARHRAEAFRDAKKYKLQPPTSQILNEMGLHDDLQHEIKQGMKGSEKLSIAAKYYKASHPGWDDSWISRITNEGTAEHYYLELLSGLFPHWRAWDHNRSTIVTEHQAREHVSR